MSARQVDAFFYGLFMDVEVLRQCGATPMNPRRAYVAEFALSIGQRATLVPSPGGRAYGMLIALTHAELERLYSAPGLENYRPEAVLAQPIEGIAIPALCYNLLQAPESNESNPDYALRLKDVLTKLGFPGEYVASVGRPAAHDCRLKQTMIRRRVRAASASARHAPLTSEAFDARSTTISRLRQRYGPATIEVLFVAESPRESGEEMRFFYNAEQERWDHLYRAVMKAVFPEFEYRPMEKDAWLRRFQEHGYYLIDATDRPVNRLAPAERRRELRSAVAAKLDEIEVLVAPHTPIILVKKNVFTAFNRPLRDAGYNVINESFLPFPSHGHQARFVEACRDCLRSARRGR